MFVDLTEFSSRLCAIRNENEKNKMATKTRRESNLYIVFSASTAEPYLKYTDLRHAMHSGCFSHPSTCFAMS